jgi:ABC-type histidine transport system ATPase subunit
MNDILPKFSDEQLAAQTALLAAIDGERTNVISIIAGAGCGKSMFVSGLTWQLRSMGRIVVNVAASALAATLLPGGMTAHSAFRIPIPATESSFCGFKPSERQLMKE